MQAKSKNSEDQGLAISRLGRQIGNFWTEARTRVAQMTSSAPTHDTTIAIPIDQEEIPANFLFTLPDELLVCICLVLHPEALYSLSLTCRRLLAIAGDEIIWERRFNRQFDSIPTPIDNFRAAFKNAYMQHNSKNRKIGVLFSLASEGDNQQLISLLDEKLKSQYYDLANFYDDKKNSFLVFLQRKQATSVLNHFFNTFYATIKEPSNISLRTNKKTILEWAVTFHLSPSELKELVKPKSKQDFSDKEFCELLVLEKGRDLKTQALQVFDGFVNEMTDYCASINSTSHLSLISLFHYSVEERHTKMVEFFIQQGADINSFSYYYGIYVKPLHIAVLNKDYEMAKLLIENGAKVDTPLMNRSSSRLGQFPNIPGGIFINDSATPFELALQLGEERISQLLLTELKENQLPISTKTLPKAIKKNRVSPELLKSLVDLKVIPNATDNGASCLWQAIHIGNMAFVQILLENGVDPNVRLNINGHLPIHFAASLGNHECIKLLHSKGADLNAPTYYGESVCSVAKDNATRNLLRELGNTGKNDSLFCAAKTLMWETGEKITSKVTPISKPESETLTVRTWRI